MTARATPPFMAAETYAGDELPGGRVSAFFPYAADFKLAPFWLPFGVRPSKDGVTVTGDSRFVATYGFRRVETPPKTSPTRTSPPTIGGGPRRERACRWLTTD